MIFSETKTLLEPDTNETRLLPENTDAYCEALTKKNLMSDENKKKLGGFIKNMKMYYDDFRKQSNHNTSICNANQNEVQDEMQALYNMAQDSIPEIIGLTDYEKILYSLQYLMLNHREKNHTSLADIKICLNSLNTNQDKTNKSLQKTYSVKSFMNLVRKPKLTKNSRESNQENASNISESESESDSDVVTNVQKLYEEMDDSPMEFKLASGKKEKEKEKKEPKMLSKSHANFFEKKSKVAQQDSKLKKRNSN